MRKRKRALNSVAPATLSVTSRHDDHDLSAKTLPPRAISGLALKVDGSYRTGGIALALAVLVAACGGGAPITSKNDEAESTRLPNILWLVAEDLSPIIAAYGDTTVETPNLSRLAAEGIRYTNAFSVSGVCAPSRFTLATGVYPTSAGGHHMRTQYVRSHLDAVGLKLYEVVPPPAVMMMSEVLRRHGYYTTNNSKQDYQFAPTLTAWDDSSVTASWRNRKVSDDRPFFSILNFDITHEGQVWAKVPSLRLLRYHQLFKDEPHPRYFEPGFGPEGSFPNHVPDDLKVPVPPYLPDTELVRRDLRRVYSNIVELDLQIGVVLNALEADGLLDDTIIVFYGDHGGPLPRQKRLLYDSGLRVPLIIRFPDGRGAGTVSEELVSFVDFAPTMFSLAGIEPPSYLEGQAFLGEYREAPRRYIHAAADRLDEHYDMIRAVRDERFKYLRNFRPEQGYYLPVRYREQMASMQELLRLRDVDGLNEEQAQWFRDTKPHDELFDTWNDPHELLNLAHEPEYAGKLEELKRELDRWMRATNDKGTMEEGELIESFWPGWNQPTTLPPAGDSRSGGIVLSSATEGASIGYQLFDGGGRESLETRQANQANGVWRVYTEPVPLSPGQSLRAVAHRIGYAPSEVIEVHAAH